MCDVYANSMLWSGWDLEKRNDFKTEQVYANGRLWSGLDWEKGNEMVSF